MIFDVFVMGSKEASYSAILDQIIEMDAYPIGTVWLAERHFHHASLMFPAPMLIASYIAAKTTRIRIGLAAVIAPLHHPLILAEQVSTLDVLSQGRFSLGLTRAGFDSCFHDVFHSPLSESFDRLLETIEILNQALSCNDVSYNGKFYKFPPISIEPKLLKKTLSPIYLVANSDTSISFAANKQMPIFINGIRTIEDIKITNNFYCNNLPENITMKPDVVLNRFIYVGESNDQAISEMYSPFMDFINNKAPDLKLALSKKYGDNRLNYDRMLEDFLIIGDANHCIEKFKAIYSETGINHFMGTFNFTTLEHDKCTNSMRKFVSHVLPTLINHK